MINTYLCCVTGQKFDAERINTEYIKLQYNRSTRRKISRSKGENQQQTQPKLASTPGFEPEPHWWEASALTTVPSPSLVYALPSNVCCILNLQVFLQVQTTLIAGKGRGRGGGGEGERGRGRGVGCNTAFKQNFMMNEIFDKRARLHKRVNYF